MTNNSMVIVTLTTIPDRLNNNSYPDGIMSCLTSLIEQSHENYEIHFNIPYIFKQTGKEYIIPESILKLQNEKFKIFRVEDVGASTKSHPTIKRIDNPETIIIVVDDDLVYHTDMVKEQVKNQEMWPECIIGYDGLRSKDNFFGDVRDYFFTSNYKTSRVDILQHYKSVSYKRRFFEVDFFDFFDDNFSWSDDLLYAAYFSYKKRVRLATFHKMDKEFKSLQEWQNEGGVTTFPILRHAQHDNNEGCNIMRKNRIDDNSSKLYKFIDHGYDI